MVCLILVSAFPSIVSSRFSWLHIQDVQRCGIGFCGAATSSYVLVSGTGFARISHISAYAAYQDR